MARGTEPQLQGLVTEPGILWLQEAPQHTPNSSGNPLVLSLPVLTVAGPLGPDVIYAPLSLAFFGAQAKQLSLLSCLSDSG